MKFVQQRKITFEAVQDIQQLTPHRICFSTTHQTALRREVDSGYVGKLVLPFPNTIYPIFYQITKLDLFPSYGNYWRSITSEAEYEQIEEFVKLTENIVFLRDTLALSIALSPHLDEELNRTQIGELEYQAKYHNNKQALVQLAELSIAACNTLPFYKDVETFCAVPPSDNQGPNLPTDIVNHIAKDYEIENITGQVYWSNPKPSLKELPLAQKWAALEQADLQVDKDLTDKTLILLDDLYQSGITMQYVAMKLQEAGANEIFGLTLVKSRRDSDNQ